MEIVTAEGGEAVPQAEDVVDAPGSALDVIEPGATTGIGSLPHRNATQAVEFALDAYDVPAIPSLPRRSPAESSIAQALVGAAGVTLGQYGTVAVDVDRLDPSAPVETDMRSDNFVGFRTFLDTASTRGYVGPVKWQFVGPISVGIALRRAGASTDAAFDVAMQAVSGHLRSLSAAVSAALPQSPQLVVLDEPFLDGLMSRDFPIAPDQAIDLLSAAMAVLEPRATTGVHCCGDVDIATLLESGPGVLSLPASMSLVPLAGYLDRFLRNGGWIAWGAIATEGPIGVTSSRSWHQLSNVWCELVQRGCQPELLRTQSLLTPDCGLGTHSVSVAERVCHSLRDVSRSLRSEAAAAKFVLGA
jgi:methionine synthase II (cobalamin-independent)